MRNLKIGVRLGLVIGLLIVIMLAIALVGALGMIHLRDRTDDIVANKWPKVVLLQQGLAGVNTISIAARDLLLAANQDDLLKSKERILESRREIGKAWEAIKPSLTHAKGQELFQQILASREDYIAGQNRLIKLAEEGKVAEGRAYLADFIAIAKVYGDRVNALVQFQGGLMAQAGQAAAEEYEHSRNLMIGASLVALLLSIGLGVWITLSITRPLQRAVTLANQLAEGNLTASVTVHGKDETGMLLAAMEQMVAGLSRVIAEVKTTSDFITHSSEELSTAAHEVSIAIERQSSATTSSAAAIEELTVSIDHVAANAKDANEKVIEAGCIASVSGNDVTAASHQIRTVASAVDSSSQEIERLSESAMHIDNIATVIREIAEQTNLLALNAAIEAARAGEQGRGFAVVADEVRKLAERTTGSVKEIGAMIGNIQNNTKAAVSSMEQSGGAVSAVVSLSEKSSSSIAETCQATDLVVQSINEISAALNEQRIASTDLARNVEAIAQMSEENTAAIGSVADTAKSLASKSSDLRSAVAYFKLA